MANVLTEKSIFSKDYETFLIVLRDERKRAGLTQAQLAAKLRQDQSFISKCERGERRLDLVEVRAFCVALEIPFVEFVQRFERSVNRGRGRK